MTTPDPSGPPSGASHDDSPTEAVPPIPQVAAAPPASPPPASAPPRAGTPRPPTSAPSAPSATPATPADRQPETAALVGGIFLVAIGGIVLLSRITSLELGPDAWPLWIVVPGVAMFVAAMFIPARGGLGLAIPGAIIATVGLVLWVQQATGLYASWAYAWALVAPAAPGFAMLVYGIVRGDGALAADGLRTFVVGIALFLGFGLFFEGVVGISGRPIAGLDQVIPYAAIGLGVVLVLLSLTGTGRTRRPT